jgi:hypothetical protein
MERQNLWAAAGETLDDSGNKLLLEAMAIVTDPNYDSRKPPSMGGLASVGQGITSRLNLYTGMHLSRIAFCSPCLLISYSFRFFLLFQPHKVFEAIEHER